MKPPQALAVLLLLAGLGLAVWKRGDGGATTVVEPAPAEPTAPVAEPAPGFPQEHPAPPERPVFRGPHDGSHVYQGVRCPACEVGPMEF